MMVAAVQPPILGFSLCKCVTPMPIEISMSEKCLSELRLLLYNLVFLRLVSVLEELYGG